MGTVKEACRSIRGSNQGRAGRQGSRRTVVTVAWRFVVRESCGILDVISTAVRDKGARISNPAYEGSSFLLPINISFYLKTEQKIRGAASLSLQRGNVTNVFLPSCAISLRVTLILFPHSSSALAWWLSPLLEEGGEEEGWMEGWKQVCFQGVATKTKESAGRCERNTELRSRKDAEECVRAFQSVQVHLYCPELRAASPCELSFL